MNRTMVWIAAAAFALAIGCSGEEAENLSEKASEAAANMPDVAAELEERATAAAGDVAADAVAACRRLAESGSWNEALEICKKAHELMPNDMGLEHAYQQAQAAAE